jgi:hypothetical protein
LNEPIELLFSLKHNDHCMIRGRSRLEIIYAESAVLWLAVHLPTRDKRDSRVFAVHLCSRRESNPTCERPPPYSVAVAAVAEPDGPTILQ